MFEQKKLYKNYKCKGLEKKDIIIRMSERLELVEKYLKNGSCKSRLIKIRILEAENESRQSI